MTDAATDAPASPAPVRAAPTVETPLSAAPVKALLIGTPPDERVQGEVSATLVNDADENAPDYVYPTFPDRDLEARHLFFKLRCV
jgi:hypothetical protein